LTQSKPFGFRNIFMQYEPKLIGLFFFYYYTWLIMKINLCHKFEDIISVENLLEAWGEFINGKKKKVDVQKFSLRLMDNIFDLHFELVNLTYKHSAYQAFKINDPKPRIIHKASVRDRLLHHAIYRLLYLFFDKIFICDSFSCRENKGTHRAIARFRVFSQKVSQNNTKTCWILKGDIKKFFASIDHGILLNILKDYIPDKKILWLLQEIISSFNSGQIGVGLPLGNLTSQLFANIYLNKFDKFIKHRLKLKHYIRYADDFVVFFQNKNFLKKQILFIISFLQERLKLEINPQKIFIKTLASGVDFLGWVNFFDHRVLRTKTKKRMLIRLGKNPKKEVLISYFGLLGWGNSYKIQKQIKIVPLKF